MNILILSCLLSLVTSCATPNPLIRALTEPSPGCDLTTITTHGELETCAAKNRVGLKKANADKARIRELVYPKPWYKRLFNK